MDAGWTFLCVLITCSCFLCVWVYAIYLISIAKHYEIVTILYVRVSFSYIVVLLTLHRCYLFFIFFSFFFENRRPSNLKHRCRYRRRCRKRWTGHACVHVCLSVWSACASEYTRHRHRIVVTRSCSYLCLACLIANTVLSFRYKCERVRYVTCYMVKSYICTKNVLSVSHFLYQLVVLSLRLPLVWTFFVCMCPLFQSDLGVIHL